MAHDIYSVPAKMISVIRVKLIGQIAVRGTVIHAGIIDKMGMQLFVASFSYKKSRKPVKLVDPSE